MSQEQAPSSAEVPFIIKPRKKQAEWSDDPDLLERAVEDGRVETDISLDVIKALNGLFRNEVSGAKNLGFKLRLSGGDKLAAIVKEKNSRKENPYLEHYEVGVREGMEIEVIKGRAIGITLREKIPHIDRLRPIKADIRKFAEGIEIIHAIRNRIVQLGFGEDGCFFYEGEYVDPDEWEMGLNLDKYVELSTPEIATAEMTKVIEALGVKKKRGKKK